MSAPRGLPGLFAVFLSVAALALWVAGTRVERDVLPLEGLMHDLDAKPLPRNAGALRMNQPMQFVVDAAEWAPWDTVAQGTDYIGTGRADERVGAATAEAALHFVLSNDRRGAPHPPEDPLAWLDWVIGRAKTADPGNGWYDFTLACVNLEAALAKSRSTAEDENLPPSVRDEEKLRRALALLEAASKASFVDSRRGERMLIRARLVPGRGMDAISQRIMVWAGTLLPELPAVRTAMNGRLIPWARASAKPEDAVRILEQVCAVARMMRHSSTLMIEWLVAARFEGEAWDALAGLHDAADAPASAMKARRAAEETRSWHHDTDTIESDDPRLGIADALWAGNLRADFDTGPGRRMDYAVVEEGAFAVLILAVVLWGFAGAVRAWAARRAPTPAEPPAATRPWTLRDLAGVVVAGVLVPALAFIAYNRTHPFRDTGIPAAGPAVLAQPLLLAAGAVLFFSWRLRRSLAGTADAPPPVRLTGILLVPVAALTAAFFLWFTGPAWRTREALVLAALAAAGAAVLVSAVAALLRARRGAPGEASLGRAQLACATAAAGTLMLLHLLVVQPWADARIDDYRTGVLEPWMTDEVRMCIKNHYLWHDRASWK
ncbi:MAG: hypothetical protein HYY18_20970 [Planctomycetes bacterium]|nr:hypothetical protein [Planctomycetota bacterium]